MGRNGLNHIAIYLRCDHLGELSSNGWLVGSKFMNLVPPGLYEVPCTDGVWQDPERPYVPCLPYEYAASADWCITQELSERIMAKSREVDGENLAGNTKQLIALPIVTAQLNLNSSWE